MSFVRKVGIDAKAAPYNATIQLVAVNGGATFELGSLNATDSKSLDITGATSGDDYKVKVITGQGQSASDKTVITYVNNANFKANFTLSGKAIQPAITFTGYTEI